MDTSLVVMSIGVLLIIGILQFVVIGLKRGRRARQGRK